MPVGGLIPGIPMEKLKTACMHCCSRRYGASRKFDRVLNMHVLVSPRERVKDISVNEESRVTGGVVTLCFLFISKVDFTRFRVELESL